MFRHFTRVRSVSCSSICLISCGKLCGKLLDLIRCDRNIVRNSPEDLSCPLVQDFLGLRCPKILKKIRVKFLGVCVSFISRILTESAHDL